VGNSVVRSHVTRLLRESYRLTEPKLDNGFDIVVIARGAMKEATYSETDRSLKHLLKKHKLLHEQQE
jgi:ribonuclease P protein component